MKSSITFGSDPELHLYGVRENRMVSALRVLGVDKKTPIELEGGARMYADNALIEASMPPEDSVNGMVLRMRDTLTKMSDRIGPSYGLSAHSSEFYDQQELEDARLLPVHQPTEEDKQRGHWAVGCNPNWDAYRRKENEIRKFTDTMRTGSFHIHLGHEMFAGELHANPKPKEILVKVLDIYLGCASVIFDRDPTAAARRRYYGRAGEFRSTPYGIEYRVLGNWSLRSPITTRLCFELAEYSVGVVVSGSGQELVEAIGSRDPQVAINENNPGLAKEILLKAATPESFMDRIFRKYRNNNLMEAWGITND